MVLDMRTTIRIFKCSTKNPFEEKASNFIDSYLHSLVFPFIVFLPSHLTLYDFLTSAPFILYSSSVAGGSERRKGNIEAPCHAEPP